MAPVPASHAPKESAPHPVVQQCEGYKKGGARCRISSTFKYREAEPLRRGFRFCAFHQSQASTQAAKEAAWETAAVEATIAAEQEAAWEAEVVAAAAAAEEAFEAEMACTASTAQLPDTDYGRPYWDVDDDEEDCDW